MQKGVLVPVAALLAACGLAATTSNDAAESATQKSDAAKQQPRIGFERFDQGGMAGCFDPNLKGQARAAAERIGGVPCETSSGATAQSGGDPWAGEYTGVAQMRITRTAADRYSVYIDSGGPGCGGEIEGAATASGNRLMLSVPVQSGYQQCRIVFDRRGGSLQATTSGDCYLFHGEQCGFAGAYRRQQSAGASTGAEPFIVGVWVHQGGYCASGDPIVFEANGSYRNSGGDLEGRWSFAGNAVTVQFSEIDPTTGEAIGAPQREVMRVTQVNASEIRLAQSRMRRCSPDGGAEPWHPGERFTTR